jgi:hypothetical protein
MKTKRRIVPAVLALSLLAGPAGMQAGNSYQARQTATAQEARPSALAPPPARPTAARRPLRQTRHARRVVVRKRRLRRSMAIVGGSAAWGAAIGAIAGGGPGAAIGALAAGGGGFLYDPFTRKRRAVE